MKYEEFVRVRMGYVGDRLMASPLNRGSGVVSSFMTADGILQGLTRQRTRGIASSPADYAYRKYRGWAKLQGYPVEGRNIGGSWMFDDPAMFSRRFPGSTCLRELENNPERATESSPRNDSKGCGGLMRVAPVGLFSANHDRDMAVAWASEIAASTHGHPFGYMAAAFLSSMIFDLSQGVGLLRAVSEAKDACRKHYGESRIDELCDIVDGAAELSGSSRPDGDCMEAIGEGWVAEETLAMAVFACLRHPDDPKACLRCAVNVTGDSDSIGSVAGNILGAHLGIDAVRSAFDLGKLECYTCIGVTAEDLIAGCPSEELGPSDDTWNRKYLYESNPYGGTGPDIYDRLRRDDGLGEAGRPCREFTPW